MIGRMSMGTLSRAVACAAALAGLCGCDAGALPPEASVRDSAGVRIVEVAAPPEAPLPWMIGAEPRVLIGGDAEDERSQLVRVTGAAVRSDGRIVIADGGLSEVRLFDADGSPAGAFGRSGGGPGEFAAMSFFGLLPGDSALIYDPRNRRFSVIAPGMGLGRTFQPTAGGDPAAVTAIAIFPGGPVVGRGPADFGATPATGVYDGAAPLLLVTAEGAVRDTLGVFPQRVSYLRLGEDTIEILRIPFGAETAYASDDDRLHVGTALEFEILSFSRDGDLVRILRVAGAEKRRTEADLEAYIADRAARAPEQARPEIRAAYEDVPVPESMPAYGALLTDAAGNLWVERYRALPDEPHTWMVFDPEGRPLGTIGTPAGVRLLEIGADYVLGSGADALDRPYVAVWPLDRAAGGSPGRGDPAGTTG